MEFTVSLQGEKNPEFLCEISCVLLNQGFYELIY